MMFMIKDKKLKRVILLFAAALLIIGTIFLLLKGFLFSNGTRAGNTYDTFSQAAFGDWVGYKVENSPNNPFDAYNLKLGELAPTSVMDIIDDGKQQTNGSANKGNDKESLIKSKLEHYPFDKIPLLEPTMIVTMDEKTIDNDIFGSIMYYTALTPEQALAKSNAALQNFNRFQDTTTNSDTGTTHSLSFAIDGEFRIDASVMVMPMPKSTGYTCALNTSYTIRGIAKKAEVNVDTTKRADGIPTRYPQDLVPILKLSSLIESNVDIDGINVMYDSSAQYKEAVDFYQKLCIDKPGFNEINDVEGEISFSAQILTWETRIRIMDNNGMAYIEITLYDQSKEAQ